MAYASMMSSQRAESQQSSESGSNNYKGMLKAMPG